MKTTITNTAVLALCLSAPALAKKRGGGSSASAGNSINTSYRFDKDNFGAGSVLNLGVQAQNNGGNAKSRRELEEAFDLYVREVEDELELVARGLFSGGTARGGDSKAQGGNKISNVNNMSKASIGANNVINMNTQTQVKGGNSQSGPGGVSTIENVVLLDGSTLHAFTSDGHSTDHRQINFGQGGKGGGLSFGKRGINGQTFSISSRVSANGRNAHSHAGQSNSQDGAPGMTMHFARGGFLSGGDAKGGDSRARGGNNVQNKNDFRGMKMGNGNTIAANTQTQVKGGNTRSGRGGANSGSGGAGGQLSLQMPPLPPIKRDLEYNDIFTRDVLDELYDELFVREAEPEPEADPELEFEEEYLYY